MDGLDQRRVIVRGIVAADATTTRSGEPSHHGLRVTVVGQASCDDELPAVCGDCEVRDATLCFTPRFPFVPGLTYRATFEPAGAASARPLDFSLPVPAAGPAAEVTGVWPSAGRLPANLLRFRVAFSAAMQRGRANDAIALLDAAGSPLSDVLYRPPVELWDRDMRHLTVYLDPGRLKRLVGPNRALGPPLAVGGHYTLRIASGMTDASGCALEAPFDKRFVVDEAVREAIAVDRWSIVRPAVATRAPLTLVFPRPLDRISLAQAIVVASSSGPVAGRVAIDHGETRWQFIPATKWQAGEYRIWVDQDLEDVCGNRPGSSFDRPLRADAFLASATVRPSLAFTL